MRDMKASKKLSAGFVVVIVLTLFVGSVGIIGMMQINSGSVYMFENQSRALADLGLAREYFQRMRVHLRDAVFESGNTAALAVIEADLYRHENGFLTHMAAYRPTIAEPELLLLHDEIMDVFADFSPRMRQIMASALVHAPPVQMILMMDDLIAPTDFIADALYYLAYIGVLQAADVNDLNQFYFEVLFGVIIASIAVSLIIAVFIVKNLRLHEYEKSKFEMQRLSEENALLEKLNQNKSEFLQDMNHEIRAPLTVIATGIDFVAGYIDRNSEEMKPAGDALDTVQNQVQRIGRMVGGMSALARMENAENRKRVDFAALLRNGAEAFRIQVEKLGGKLNIDIAQGLPDVFVEQDRFAQVIANLISNTIDHLKEGEITVSARLSEGGNFIVATVKDNGGGISPDLLPRIFERGVSGRSGTGYGLYICKTIVDAHGGNIEIESSQGGTTAAFTVPVYGGQEAGRASNK